MLKLENVNTFYHDVQVLYDISFEIDKGEIVTILGANGAGKTTLIKTICNLVPAKSGSITFEGKLLTKVPPYEYVSMGISLVPEGRHLFPGMSVYDNLLLGAYSLHNKTDIEENMNWVMDLFPKLKTRAKQQAGTLSGGEQQMCAIARGLMIKPRMVIFDEPSLGLAPIIVEQIFETISSITKEGTSILLVEQNAQTALEVSKRGIVLENGRVSLFGSSQSLLNNPDVQKAYLGL